VKWEERLTKFGVVKIPVRAYGDISKAMSSDVKRVSSTLKDMLKEVKQQVTACEDDVRMAHKETLDAVGMARGMMKQVRDDVAELRGLLGENSNFPPSETL
jgi:hypothetical protein